MNVERQVRLRTLLVCVGVVALLISLTVLFAIPFWQSRSFSGMLTAEVRNYSEVVQVTPFVLAGVPSGSRVWLTWQGASYEWAAVEVYSGNLSGSTESVACYDGPTNTGEGACVWSATGDVHNVIIANATACMGCLGGENQANFTAAFAYQGQFVWSGPLL
jgi:hypothetical protein